MRRGFTILEITLAITMGMIVLSSAALSLLAALGPHRRRASTPATSTVVELTRARTTIQRAMTSLVMEDSPQNQNAAHPAAHSLSPHRNRRRRRRGAPVRPGPPRSGSTWACRSASRSS